MNILVFSADFPPFKAGIQIFVYNICREVAALGHRVRVLTKSSRGDKEFDRHQKFLIHRYNYSFRFSSTLTIFKILFILIKEKTDVLFFGRFGSVQLLGGVFAKKVIGVPYGILVHGNDVTGYMHGFTWFDRLISRVILKNASVIIANSNATKKVVENHGYPSNQIHIVNPGTDIEEFKPCDDADSIKKQLKIINKKLLLSVSRLAKRKGHENVIKALPKVIDEVPQLLYVIVGEGDEKVHLKTLVEDMELDRYVRFVGHVGEEEKISYYQSCDVFIMPSFEIKCGNMNDYEGFGIVYVEANACGKPVIAGKSGGVEDAVVDGVTGLVVDPHKIEEISNAIVRLLTDQNYARELGKNGRKRVEKKLTWEIVGKKVESILKKELRAN